ELSMALLAIPVIGGVGSVAGAIAATALLYFPTLFWSTYLERLLGDSAPAGVYLLLSGLTTVGVVLQFPTGLAGAAQRLWERFIERIDRQLKERQPEAVGGPVLVAAAMELRFGGIGALQGASIEVNAGEIVGLIGPNGAGKSTLINVLSGALRADSGTV